MHNICCSNKNSYVSATLNKKQYHLNIYSLFPESTKFILYIEQSLSYWFKWCFSLEFVSITFKKMSLGNFLLRISTIYTLIFIHGFQENSNILPLDDLSNLDGVYLE